MKIPRSIKARTCGIEHCDRGATSEVVVGTGANKSVWDVCGKHLAQVCTILLSPTPTEVTR